MPSTALAAADGRWPALLMALAGLRPDQLTNRHQPCPACGGDDRYRWDRDDGPGGWFCSHCGGRDGRGGGGTGMGLLMRVKGWSFKQAARAIEWHLGIPAGVATPKRPHVAPQGPPKRRRRSAEMTAHGLLAVADALPLDALLYSPALARKKHYSALWASYEAEHPEEAAAARLEAETEEGIQDPEEAAAITPSPPQTPAIHSKLQKLEASELLALLRTREIRYNTFSQQVELDGSVVEGVERFYLRIAEKGYKVTKELAIDCLVQVAHENPYDPVTLYLDHVAATVQPAFIDSLASAYLRKGDPGGTLYDAMIKATLIGAVRRAFEPGCKHDTACILVGTQGGLKSTFWKALGGPFFSDALRDISTKDDLMVLHRSWIMEWAELDHITGRKQAGMIKAFLSQATDLFRVPYGKATEAFPRRGIIVGSTNQQDGLLVDPTGNRRFWMVPVTATRAEPIDCTALSAERDAIWSAAVAAYRAGEPSHLPLELAIQADEEASDYCQDSPWREPIARWLTTRIPGEPITVERILLEAIDMPLDRQGSDRRAQMEVANVLRQLNYERRRSMVEGRRCWRWHRCPT